MRKLWRIHQPEYRSVWVLNMTDVDFLLNRAGLTWQQVDRLAGFKLSRTLPLGVEGLDEAKRQRLRYLVDQLTTAFAERGAVTLDARRLALLDSSHGMSLFHGV